MTRIRRLVFALALALAPASALAAPAPPVAPCTTILTTQAGIQQQSCQPVTTGAPLPVTPSGGSPPTPYTYTPLGCQQITSLGSATGFSSIPTGATLVSMTIEGQPVRMRDDGTAPTTAIGLLLSVGGPWPYSGSLSALQFIQTAASATIDGCFYK